MNGNGGNAMMERIAIDTNIAIRAFKNHPKALALLNGKEVILNFIVPIELLSYPDLSTDEEVLINQFLSECIVQHNSTDLEATVIQLRKAYGLKIPDAFVAATALFYRLHLFSSDSVFERIPELNFVFVEF